ncbi:hypothetical protein CYMTET_33550, partial [Cymbomonas tetramitiformis]
MESERHFVPGPTSYASTHRSASPELGIGDLWLKEIGVGQRLHNKIQSKEWDSTPYANSSFTSASPMSRKERMLAEQRLGGGTESFAQRARAAWQEHKQVASTSHDPQPGGPQLSPDCREDFPQQAAAGPGLKANKYKKKPKPGPEKKRTSTATLLAQASEMRFRLQGTENDWGGAFSEGMRKALQSHADNESDSAILADLLKREENLSCDALGAVTLRELTTLSLSSFSRALVLAWQKRMLVWPITLWRASAVEANERRIRAIINFYRRLLHRA